MIKKNILKALSTTFAAVMLLSGCNNSGDQGTVTGANTNTDEVSEPINDVPVAELKGTGAEIPKFDFEAQPMPDSEALSFVQNLKIGCPTSRHVHKYMLLRELPWESHKSCRQLLSHPK